MTDGNQTTASKKDDLLRMFLLRAERERRECGEKWGFACMGVYYADEDIRRIREALDVR